jgi:hypothetical protein
MASQEKVCQEFSTFHEWATVVDEPGRQCPFGGRNWLT